MYRKRLKAFLFVHFGKKLLPCAHVVERVVCFCLYRSTEIISDILMGV
jgi:hypothetical protein